MRLIFLLPKLQVSSLGHWLGIEARIDANPWESDLRGALPDSIENSRVVGANAKHFTTS